MKTCLYLTILLFTAILCRDVPLRRYYNRNIKDYLYTTNFTESDLGKHGWEFEAHDGRIFQYQEIGSIPLYRYWSGRDHFYTTNITEIGTSIPGKTGKHGYISEGITGFCYPHKLDGLIPLYRYWNIHILDHLYTTDINEIGTASPGSVGKNGYKSQGVACYVKPNVMSNLNLDFPDIHIGETVADCQDPVEVFENFCERRESRFRSTRGFCNNLEPGKGAQGASGAIVPRYLDAKYFDLPLENYIPFGHPLLENSNWIFSFKNVPSAQDVSDAMLKISPVDQGNKRRMSHMYRTFGQFLEHDLVYILHESGSVAGCRKKCDPSQGNFKYPCFPISSKGRIEERCVSFVRSSAACPKNQSYFWWPIDYVRDQINYVTSFIDGSMIYGSEERRAINVRGSVFLSIQQVRNIYGQVTDLLPFDKESGDPCQKIAGCFLAGDTRVNENIALAGMYTVWVRLHNYFAKAIQKYTKVNVFNEARNMVVSTLQHITFEEWLPYLTKLDKYKGYNKNVDPGVRNGFATAAFRFIDKLVRNEFEILQPNFTPLRPQEPLRNTFNNMTLILKDGIEPVMLGLIGSQSEVENVDRVFSASIGETLFIPTNQKGFQNLAALNIQRGRDHGLPSYTEWRRFCGLKPNNFVGGNPFDAFANEIKNPAIRDAMQKLYKHPSTDHIDLFSAGISEDKVGDFIIGPTFGCIFKEQFEGFRNGDRFFYTNKKVFTQNQIREAEKMTLAKVLCLTLSNITVIQRNVFDVLSPEGKTTCAELLGNDGFLNVETWLNNPLKKSKRK